MSKAPPFTFIDLFCGIGGFSPAEMLACLGKAFEGGILPKICKKKKNTIPYNSINSNMESIELIEFFEFIEFIEFIDFIEAIELISVEINYSIDSKLN